MENVNYITLSRQSGLLAEMQVVANNIANISTTGYKREGVIFSEYVRRIGEENSLSMARGNTRHIDLLPGNLKDTGGGLDFAIQGAGFFLVSTSEGNRLTRSGAFSVSPENNLVNYDGQAVLDDSLNPINLPAGFKNITVSAGGDVRVDDEEIARIGIWHPQGAADMRRAGGALFSSRHIELSDQPVIRQGYLEDSNVNAVSEIANMIEIQRTYELGQKFLDSEDQRQRTVISSLGK